jgi:hypothetical protein
MTRQASIAEMRSVEVTVEYTRSSIIGRVVLKPLAGDRIQQVRERPSGINRRIPKVLLRPAARLLCRSINIETGQDPGVRQVVR